MVSSNDVQRLFLQAIMSRRMVSQPLAAKIWEKCIAAVKATDETLNMQYDDRREAWDDWVNKINHSLDPLDLEFVHLTDEITGKETYAFVNRKQDEVAQMATEYTPAEIAYFKGVIEQIMLAPNETFCVSSFTALREVNSKNMTKTQAEIVLASFVAKGWLIKSRRGRYSLSTRTKLELSNYLKNTYPEEIIECTICMEILTRGIACGTPHCKARLHDHCYKTYRRAKAKCPSCGESWASDDKVTPVGEAAYKEGQDKGRRRTRQTEVAEEDEDEDASQMDADESQPSQSQSQPSQSQPKRKGKKKAVVSDDEDMDAEGEAEEEEEEDVKPNKRKGRR